MANWRVLGPPSPGRSFGRGLYGPKATVVRMDPVGNLSGQSVKNMKRFGRVDRIGLERDTMLASSSRAVSSFLKFATFWKRFNIFRNSKSGRAAGFWLPQGRQRFRLKLSATRMAGVSCFFKSATNKQKTLKEH